MTVPTRLPLPAVRVDAVTWTREGNPVLDAVTCTAPAGAVTGLIGPNGSGKTSLISVLARLAHPDSGDVSIGGRSIGELHRREFATQVALVDQHSATELELTVEQVVALGVIPHRRGWARPAGTDHSASIEASLAATGITSLRDRLWQNLSGGEKQKTQLARALAQQPRVLLLDEPTNHLDVSSALGLLDLIRNHAVTTVAAMHDLNLAATYCDHLVVLRRGRVVTQGPPDRVLTPGLLADVYGIEALVQRHPRTGRPLVVLCGTTTTSGRTPP